MNLADELRRSVVDHAARCTATPYALQRSDDHGGLFHILHCAMCGWQSPEFFVYDRDAAAFNAALHPAGYHVQPQKR
jgi:hypothetical protein